VRVTEFAKKKHGAVGFRKNKTSRKGETLTFTVRPVPREKIQAIWGGGNHSGSSSGETRQQEIGLKIAKKEPKEDGIKKWIVRGTRNIIH